MSAAPQSPTPPTPRLGIPVRSLSNWEPDERLQERIRQALNAPEDPVAQEAQDESDRRLS